MQPHEALDAFELKARGLLYKLEKMVADDNVAHLDDIGELRGQVRGLQAGFVDLGRKLDEGLGRLTDYIRTSTEKTEARIDAGQQRTDARFEALAQAQLQQVAGRTSNYSANLALAVSTVIGLAGLAATLWALTKAPIDASFSRLEAAQSQLTTDLKQTAEKFVPKEQVKVQIDDVERRLDKVSDRQSLIERDLSAADADIRNHSATLDRLHDEQANLATKSQVSDLNERETTISNRLQTVYDKNFVPSMPTASPPPVSGTVGR